ncbi:MAG TPA: ABC transporter permease, partial [Myxococcaceae bacterium]|nr:ABC transporter permease [Myxococcaceae bacterium]
MAAYLLKRLLLLGPVLLGLSAMVFALVSLVPGDPALALLGPYATPERVAELHRELGLDGPLPLRYATWLGNVLHGELGRSYSLNRPVLDTVLERLGPTLLLAGAALVLATLLGLVAGAVSAVHRQRWPDRVLTLLSLAGLSTPAFWLALLLVSVLAVQARFFPVSGMSSGHGPHAGGVLDLLHHLALPALSLALIAAGIIARVTRTAMLEVLGQGYIRNARARGIPEEQLLYRHAFRNAVVSVIPVIGLQAGFVLGGAVYIETVFQWPGLGRMLVDAILARDLLLVQGGVLVVATAYVLINLCTDL